MPTSASGGLVTALKTSLADATHGWAVTAVEDAGASEQQIVSVAQHTETLLDAYGGSAPLRTTTFDVSSTAGQSLKITVQAAHLLAAAGATSLLTIAYTSRWVNGVYSSGLIDTNGAQLTTSDAALDTTLRALATAFLSAKDTALTAALGAGPASAAAALSVLLHAR